MNPRVVFHPVEESIPLSEVYQHLRIDYDSDAPADELLITSMLGSAREFCENFTGLTFAPKTLELSITEDIDSIYLPFGPVVEIINVTYETYESVLDSDGNQIYDSDGVAEVVTTLNRTTYKLNPLKSIISGFGTKPSATNNFKVTYYAGYGNESDTPRLPYAAKAAMLLILGHLYENRQDATEKALTSIPNGAESLLRPLRERLGMA